MKIERTRPINREGAAFPCLKFAVGLSSQGGRGGGESTQARVLQPEF